MAILTSQFRGMDTEAGYVPCMKTLAGEQIL